ncbi:MAG: GumC family protein [Bacteroidota bacterium]
MVADETESRGPTEALSILWQRKTLIGAVVAGSTALALVALQVIPPNYTAEALIALNTRSSASEQLLTTKPNVAAPPLTTVMVSTEINILESRELAGQVVDALALDRDAEFNTRLEPLPLPNWLATAWRSLRGEDDGSKDDRTLTVDAVLKHLKVKSDADSFVIRLAFTSEEPRKSALIANAFTDLYIRGQREAKLAEMQLATDWITKQITRLQGDLAKETGAAVRLRQKYKVSPVDVREKGVMASQQLVTLTGELAQVERERAEAEASLSQARRVMKTGGATTSLTFVEESPFLQEMRREEAKILGHMAELSVGYRDDSPAMSALKGQLATLRSQIDREVGQQVERMANKAAQARAREDVLKARIDSIQNHASQSDEAITEIEQREKLVEAKNLMLESFLSRYAELTNRAEVQEPDARIASRATAPAKPSSPKPLLFLGVAFAGSSALSVSLAFLLERFRTGFRSTRQVREALGLPSLGILPDTTKLTPRVLPGDYLVDRPESVYAEAVRSAQIAITNAREGKRRATLITSSVPGEGKTAFAVSLGRSLALAERKVVLVDCDLRRPAVARQLAAYEVPGLSDYLRQQSSLEEIIRHDARSGLDFIASGGRTTEPQRLLEDTGLPKLFDRLFDLYDMVLVDTPPTMVAFDTALLAPFADFSLYVVEWDRTPRRAVEAGIEHLRSFDIPIGGVVLTKVDLERQRQYSDYVDFCFRSSDYYGN